MSKPVALLALLLACAAARAQDLSTYPIDETDKTPPSELRLRRTQIKQTIGPGAVGVFFTNPVRNRNNDVDFLFRGDSNFLYLTGFEEPDSTLILIPDGVSIDGKTTTEILFLNEPNLASITWLGYRMGPKNAESLLGIEMALPNKRFAEVLKTVLKPGVKVSTGGMPDGSVGVLEKMMGALAESKPEAGPQVQRKLSTMRGVKSAYEIGILKKVCDYSARGHVEVMKAMKPGMREWETSALMQYIYAKNGCEYSGYPPICGSGPNSTILHYESNRRLMKDGDIYCMDAAGEYHGYSADVTRSFPVNGKFSPAQKAIYQIVYDGQETGINMCRTGTTMGAIDAAIRDRLARGLIALGVIKEANELGRYYMHGFGHGIGLDVHDPVPGTLAPGACLTVEPGIYIKEGSPCDPKYWNIGIRIEDDILVTDGAPLNMSIGAPRKWDEIEKLMASG